MRVNLGHAGVWEGTQLGKLIPAGQKDVPDHMVPCQGWVEGSVVFPSVVFPGDCGWEVVSRCLCITWGLEFS